MLAIVFASERLREVRITLPVGCGVAVGQSRIADRFSSVITSDTTMWKRIAVAIANHLGWIRLADEIAFAARIAPRALRIPVPGFHVQFGVLPIAYGPPSGLKDLIYS